MLEGRNSVDSPLLHIITQPASHHSRNAYWLYA